MPGKSSSTKNEGSGGRAAANSVSKNTEYTPMHVGLSDEERAQKIAELTAKNQAKTKGEAAANDAARMQRQRDFLKSSPPSDWDRLRWAQQELDANRTN